MAEIEEMKIENENVKVEEMRIDNRVTLTKVYIGNGDDFIVVSGNDMSIYLKFVNARNRFMSLADSLEKEELKIKEKYKGDENTEISEEDEHELLKLYRDFSEESERIMDGVFGEETTRKFWKDVYEVIPDFIPKVEAWTDFFDSLIPVAERLSDHSERLEKLSSMKRMAKYAPQDHKRPREGAAK